MFKKRSKKAIMGIGMLLIFIASIVASTIAAGVLITSTGILQERALRVEEISRERLISGLDIVSIYANGNRENQTINEFEITMRLRAGSRPIQLATLGVSFISGNITFSANINETILGTDNCTFNQLNPETEFCVNHIFGEDGTTILDDGDMVTLRYKLSEENALSPETRFELSLRPKIGNIVIIELNAPDMVLNNKIRLR